MRFYKVYITGHAVITRFSYVIGKKKPWYNLHIRFLWNTKHFWNCRKNIPWGVCWLKYSPAITRPSLYEKTWEEFRARDGKIFLLIHRFLECIYCYKSIRTHDKFADKCVIFATITILQCSTIVFFSYEIIDIIARILLSTNFKMCANVNGYFLD